MKKGKSRTLKDEYTEAYLDYYSLVYSTIYTKTGSNEDADDLCQEVFIIFYNKFDKIENKRAWLLGTIRNVLYKFYRDKKDDTVDIDEIFNDISLTFVNGFRDTRLLISEAMENIDIDELERNIFDLIATMNYSYNEVADLVGFSRRQVQYRYISILNKLVDYLKKKGINRIEDLL